MSAAASVLGELSGAVKSYLFFRHFGELAPLNVPPMTLKSSSTEPARREQEPDPSVLLQEVGRRAGRRQHCRRVRSRSDPQVRWQEQHTKREVLTRLKTPSSAHSADQMKLLCLLYADTRNQEETMPLRVPTDIIRVSPTPASRRSQAQSPECLDEGAGEATVQAVGLGPSTRPWLSPSHAEWSQRESRLVVPDRIRHHPARTG